MQVSPLSFLKKIKQRHDNISKYGPKTRVYFKHNYEITKFYFGFQLEAWVGGTVKNVGFFGGPGHLA